MATPDTEDTCHLSVHLQQQAVDGTMSGAPQSMHSRIAHRARAHTHTHTHAHARTHTNARAHTAACKKLAGKKVKEQFWDKGKQVLQPIILRAGLLYESLYAYLPTLKEGHLYLPTPVDGRMPFVSLDDVGAVAAEILVRQTDKVMHT
jgi:hypothetical protein